MMQGTMLTNEQLLFLQQEKQQLNIAKRILSDFNLPEETFNALNEAILQLDELFLIVVVGEFNSGKSALINALLGEYVLEEGVTPTTARVTLVRWGETLSEQIVNEDFAIVTYPLELLKELNLIDSPGTNAIIRRHELLTTEYVPRSDLVLFTTSADRPLTESEREFLEKILAWGKKIVLVINKADILDGQEAIEEVRAFVAQHTAGILGYAPELFVLSAKMAEKANQISDLVEKERLRKASGITDFERYITETLDDRARLELKLSNPLGVASNLLQQAEGLNQAQAEELQADLKLVSELEAMLSAYRKELTAEIKPRLAEVDNVLQNFEQRGEEFFNTNLRITNIGNLAKSDKIKAKFEEEVLAGLSQEIDAKVHTMIDWMVDKDLQIWYQVMGALERRQFIARKQAEVGPVSPQAARRTDLMASVGETIKTIVNSYNHKKEAEELSVLVEGAVAQTALFEVGAVGLGALVASTLFSAAMDVTGIVAASALAILGLFVIPYKRKQAIEGFKEKMNELRSNLMHTLELTFRREADLALSRLEAKIAPYTQGVRADQEKIARDAQVLAELKQTLEKMQDQMRTVL
ncbi:MAG TPA: dynamin family protein [Anaerolineaceae bacterium]|nr:dynamin family protein [Anaerolineaceae bacterium]